METEHIAKKDLKHGAYYNGSCRNASVARWNNDKQLFYHWRTKFADRFVETIKHREDDDHYDVFDAYEEIPDTVDYEHIPFR